MTKPKVKPEQKSYEESLDELQGLVEAMESGELSLEASMEAFEKGIKLTRQAQKALAEAEQKVQLLVAGGDGPEATPFHPDEEEADN
jgi:exodeoxyribonuclease VII small subunit